MSSDPAGVEEVPLLALRPLRHACHACGTCCHGWLVRLRPDEVAPVVAYGAALGVEDPIAEGCLRRTEGHCVFLAEDGRCRIHATFGATAKPRVCQRYPLRATLAEDGLRVGVDPSCTTDARSWRDGPLVEPLRTHDRTQRLPPERAAMERELLELASLPGLTIAEFTAAVVHSPEAPPELPRGFATRVLARLRSPALADHLRNPRHGAALLAQIAHLPAALEALTARRLPAWSGRLSPERDALALDALRRHLFLRLGDPQAPPLAQALLVLAGVFACAWADPGPTFEPALAAWLRLVRSPPVWGRVVPDSDSVRWLLTGSR